MTDKERGMEQAGNGNRTQSEPEKGPATRRIETQIHRRKKAKAVYPLEAEWQIERPEPPQLRTPADRMKRKPE